ncbi:MAG: ethanolamine ammonia-lyase subunit EutC [Chthoniobacter sp.]|nr:ethanolamine ammonia-lyase subunit EutC [Chthoniobacter sp.]
MGDLSLTPDPWHELRDITAARIALGRTGGSVPTRALLDFRLAHARARDAVLSHFDADALAAHLQAFGHPVLLAESAARDRAEFLQRPDLGRRLGHDSRARLVEAAAGSARCDLVIIISDGLSTLAATTQSEPLLAALLPLLDGSQWSLAPLIVARHARVGLQDEIGEIFRAKISLMLLGERPGLGSADSLGAYFTHAPALGMTDADRNCISNIRPGGLSSAEAAHKLHYLLTQSRTLGLSGVALKDDAPALPNSEAEKIRDLKSA